MALHHTTHPASFSDTFRFCKDLIVENDDPNRIDVTDVVRLLFTEHAKQSVEIREAQQAARRLIVNFIISIADIFPPTEFISWAADIGKVIGRVRKSLKKSADTTPDAGLMLAIGTELLEPLTGFVLPSHFFETFKQLRYDISRFQKGVPLLKEKRRG